MTASRVFSIVHQNPLRERFGFAVFLLLLGLSWGSSSGLAQDSTRLSDPSVHDDWNVVSLPQDGDRRLALAIAIPARASFAPVDPSNLTRSKLGFPPRRATNIQRLMLSTPIDEYEVIVSHWNHELSEREGLDVCVALRFPEAGMRRASNRFSAYCSKHTVMSGAHTWTHVAVVDQRVIFLRHTANPGMQRHRAYNRHNTLFLRSLNVGAGNRSALEALIASPNTEPH